MTELLKQQEPLASPNQQESLEELTPQELFSRIRTDKDGTVRDAALARIEEKARQIRRAIDAGVEPKEFQLLKKVQTALETSSLVVDRVWTMAALERHAKGE